MVFAYLKEEYDNLLIIAIVEEKQSVLLRGASKRLRRFISEEPIRPLDPETHHRVAAKYALTTPPHLSNSPEAPIRYRTRWATHGPTPCQLPKRHMNKLRSEQEPVLTGAWAEMDRLDRDPITEKDYSYVLLDVGGCPVLTYSTEVSQQHAATRGLQDPQKTATQNRAPFIDLWYRVNTVSDLGGMDEP